MDKVPLSDLRSVNEKRRWAAEHLKSIENHIADIRHGNPYPMVVDRYPESGLYEARIVEVKPVSFDNLCLMIGDCIHNMRSALDHIIWQLTDRDINDMDSLFPIAHDSTWFEKRGRKRLLRVKSEGATALVEKLQPYNTGNKTLLHLQALDAADKHRLLTVTVPVVGLVGFSGSQVPGKAYKATITPIFTARLEPNAIVARMKVTPPTPEVQVDIDFTPNISFGHDFGLGPNTWAVVELKRMLITVDDVIQQFTQFFDKA